LVRYASSQLSITGKRQLHAADVRQHLEAILAQLIAHVAGQAVEHRVAVDQQRRSPPGRRLNLGHQLIQVAADHLPLGITLLDQPQHPLGTQQQFGTNDQITRRRAEPVESVVADANDCDTLHEDSLAAGSRSGEGAVSCW
jgi:hypothetical protein